MKKLLMTIALSLMAAQAAFAVTPNGLATGLVATTLAQEDEERDPTEGRNVKRTPTMREPVYRRLSEAQQAAEADDLATARELIDEIANLKGLTPYETAQMYNFRAYLAYTDGNYPGAIAAYKSVLAQEDLPEAMENQTLYSLSQLSFASEDYRGAINYLRQWMDKIGNPKPDSYMLLGQAYYQLEEYANALEPVNRGIQMTRDEGGEVKEDWLLLQRVLYYEMENYEKVAEILEELVQRFPKKTYWLQLAGMYGQLEQPEKRLITLDLAYQQGLFDRGQEYLNLAQLLLQQEIPYRGAMILKEGMDKGLVEKDSKNLRLLAQAFMLAQEDDMALEPLQAAARVSDDGDLNMQLGNVYYNREEFAKAEEAAISAINKNVDDKGDAWMLVGMSRFAQEKLNSAQEAFENASKYNGNRSQANQWMSYIDKERQRREQLAAAL